MLTGIAHDCGFPGMRHLLLRSHSRNVARRRLVWPDVGFSRSDNGWMRAGAALCLPLLAPRGSG
jgi:hypothetical protein